jgi:two-component system LytT family response regulator
MKPLRCILIDDEPGALTSLAYELAQLGRRIELIQQFTHPQSAQNWLINNEIDLVFLDIHMPSMNGLQWLDQFKERPFDVILSTAHSEYAFEAIKRHVSGYLMKPTDPTELERLINDIENNKNRSPIFTPKEIPSPPLPLKIQVPIDRKIVLLDPNQITHCESDGNYTLVYMPPNKKLLLTQQLGKFTKLLPAFQFYRVHHSFVVNLHRVQEMHKTEGYLVMDSGERVPVSRLKKKKVLEAIEKTFKNENINY